MICLSDKGCSLVIQTQINYGSDDIVCTEVDGVDAQPPCAVTTGNWTITTFQGVPDLAKGVHTVQTKMAVGEDGGITVSGFQLVYTMYEHQ